MKYIFFLSLILGLISCDNSINNTNVYFNGPFPKHFIDLTNYLGDEFSLRRADDTISYYVKYERNTHVSTVIESKTNDTVFSGFVNKYRGLIYFNRVINDSTYWISVVRIKNGIIQGFGTEWVQMYDLADKINSLLRKNEDKELGLLDLIQSINSDTSEIRLNVNKKVLKRFYSSIIDSLHVDTLIYTNGELPPINNMFTNDNIIDSASRTANDIVLKLYPNPATDIINIETNNSSPKQYIVINENSKILFNHYAASKNIKFDISDFAAGMYFLYVVENESDIQMVKFTVL